MENDLTAKYPTIRILYSRADEEKTGHLAVCALGLKDETLQALLAEGVTSHGKLFKFTECSSEELSKFWEQHGTHY